MPGDARPGRSRDSRLGRRRRRAARTDDEHAHDRGEARLELQRAHVVHVALPDHRPARRERALRLRRAGAGARRRGGERPPPLRPLRALRGARRRNPGRGAPARERPAGAGDPDRDPRAAEARRAWHPGLPDRRLQHAVPPRLDACGGRGARRRSLPGRLAGGQGVRRRRLQGFLPPGLSEPDRAAWDSVGRPARPRERRSRCTTGSTGCSPVGPATATASSVVGEPGTRTWTSPSTRGPRITAASSRPSTSRLPRCLCSWPSGRGAWSRASRSASRFHARGQPGERGRRPGRGDAVPAASKSTGGAVDGTLTFATGALAPRAYEAVLVEPGRAAISRSPFWLYRARRGPRSPRTSPATRSARLSASRGRRRQG